MFRIIILLVLPCLIISKQDDGAKDSYIREYFESDKYKSFQKHWQAHKKSFENAILLALKENYGYRGMNVFVRRSADSLHLTRGFYLNDNIVELLLMDMTLTSLPHITMPEVTFALASNVLLIEAGLGKMIVESRYMLFRNQSSIQFKGAQDPYKTSPFSYQQIDNYGQLTIIAEDCTLAGYTIARLNGHSINLGHENFQVKDCKFSVEISPHGNGWPPLIAPYFSVKQSKQLEILLTRPIREELMPKLQAAVFTYINTSVIFGDYLKPFREYQNNLFKDSVKSVKEFLTAFNDITIELTGETMQLDTLKVSWDTGCQNGPCSNVISVHNVTLHGLDTLYSSHMGGPFKLQKIVLGEGFRFNSMLVRGRISYENETLQAEHDFVADMKDVDVNFEVYLDGIPVFSVRHWRTLEVSVNKIKNDLRDFRAPSAFITGYLIDKLPGALEKHFSTVFDNMKNSAMTKLSNVNVNCNNWG